MFRMFHQFFAMFTSLFTAGEKLANSAVNLSEWADESTATFRDKAREDRKQALIKLQAKTLELENKHSST